MVLTCLTAASALNVLRPVFYADVDWPPHRCDLTLLEYYLWDAVNDECYADKPETIDSLKDNIRETIGAHNR